MQRNLEKRGKDYYKISSQDPVFQCAFYPEVFRFQIDNWQLNSWIEADELDFGDQNLWNAAMPRKPSAQDLWGEGTVLPLQFSEEVQNSLYAEVGKKYNSIINVIDENGWRPFTGNVNVYLTIDEIANGYAWHLAEKENDIHDVQGECINFYLKIPSKRMNWLRETLSSIPYASLELYMNIATYEHAGQLRGLHPWIQPTFALEPDSWTPIVAARITVMAQPQPRPSPSAEVCDAGARQPRSGSSGSPAPLDGGSRSVSSAST